MTADARWFDVDAQVRDAAEHFDKATRLFALGGFEGADLKSYQASMASEFRKQIS